MRKYFSSQEAMEALSMGKRLLASDTVGRAV
jgi:hypothetical protein